MNKGLWVKFEAQADAYPGAQRSRDGKVVGILVPAGVDTLTGEPRPAVINIVRQDIGDNLMGVVGNEACNITVDPVTTAHERCDIPGDCPIERVRHLVEGSG